MTRRRAIQLSIVLALLIGGVFTYPTSQQVIVGWVKGESFYQGRPTSYWKSDLDRWDDDNISLITDASGRIIVPVWQRKPTRWEQWLEDHLPLGRSPASPHPLQEGDPAGVPVLIELLEGANTTKERRFAAEALAEIGPDAKPAVPAIVKALEGETRKRQAFYATVNEESNDIQRKVKTLKFLLSDYTGHDLEKALAKIDPEAGKRAGVEP